MVVRVAASTSCFKAAVLAGSSGQGRWSAEGGCNAGGGAGPDFWCAFEDGKVVVIGDEPANTINDRSRRRLLCRLAKDSYSPC